ncbi:hypothetical protein CBR_g4814 [Chara braunii]|uniref:CCHC-type domain-containing protein n=1 Tax=Chara braunii TaxID=69332 RepID=A0A388KIX6_CHABU|nr:hypothetical protein CBR_g4814 [Chara braunii]|eukprot:GBG69986.1 hypothetical protein CBR_g4814 [Chara braunii]
MSGSGYRDDRERGRGGERERSYDDGRNSSWDTGRERGRDGRRDRYDDEVRSHGYRDGPRCAPVTCYECGEQGHYRNQCPRLAGKSSVPRGRSTSPGHVTRLVARRSSSEEPVIRKQLEELTSSIASMKNFIDAEQTRKEKDERLKKEEAKREAERVEQLRREAEEQQVKERRAKKKEEKKRKEIEAREALRKELRIEMNQWMGAMCEGVHDRLLHTMRSEDTKGKAKLSEYASEDSNYSDDSEIEALSEHTTRLNINDKRKREPDLGVGDSPLVVTPVKRTAKRGVLDPKKLLLSCRHPPLKKPSPKRKTPGTGSATRRRKIPASPGVLGKLRYVQENLRQLGGLNMEELRAICRSEEVAFERKKMDILLAITEKRAYVAYGTNEETRVRNATEEVVEETQLDDASEGDKESELRRWHPKVGPDKRFLCKLFRNPLRKDLLGSCSLEALVRMMRSASIFQKAASTAYLRRLISGSIKDSYGFSINARIIVRLKFDDRVRMVEVRKLANDLIEGLPYPRVGAHVLFRLQELEGVNPLICNARNVPKLSLPYRGTLLAQEIVDGIQSWVNFHGATPTVTRVEADRCLIETVDAGSKYLDPKEVEKVRGTLDGLVLTPLDRNPGKTLVLCPQVYFEGMMSTFVMAPDYDIMEKSEEDLLRAMREDASKAALLNFV